VWNNLEVAYRDHLSRQDDDARLASDLDWLHELPVAQLAKRGLIRRCQEPVDQLREICRFFGVANRAAWEAVWYKPTAFRTSKAFASDPGAVAAWLRIGEIEAAAINCAPFDRASLLSVVDELRELTLDPDPRRWWPSLVEVCAAVGVAVVLLPRSRVHASTAPRAG
jgi:HTH-type transcriptional regulator/antitoxin HigA